MCFLFIFFVCLFSNWLPTDKICRQGVSTGVMLTDQQLESESVLSSITKHLVRAANNHINHIICIDADDIDEVITPDEIPPHGIFLVDTCGNLDIAEQVATYLTPHFTHPTRAQSLARQANRNVHHTAPLAVAVMATGPGDWALMLPMPLPPSPYERLQRPRQSSSMTETEATALGGIFSLAGHALTRCDSRNSLGHHGVSPGEGRLRLDQIVLEMLSKSAMLDKFGA